MTRSLTITLNGAPHPIAEPIALDRLLEELGLAAKPVVVELNARAVLPRCYPLTRVAPGDRSPGATRVSG